MLLTYAIKNRLVRNYYILRLDIFAYAHTSFTLIFLFSFVRAPFRLFHRQSEKRKCAQQEVLIISQYHFFYIHI